jgi:hypothetical protein
LIADIVRFNGFLDPGSGRGLFLASPLARPDTKGSSS